MSVKLDNSEARYFRNLITGMTEDQIRDRIQSDIHDRIEEGYIRPEYADSYLAESYRDLEEAAKVYAAMKPLQTPEVYAVNPWGYDQTNYENMTIVGQVGSSMIGMLNHKVVAIAKNKYTTRTYADLDGVRSTSWEPALSDDTLRNSTYQR